MYTTNTIEPFECRNRFSYCNTNCNIHFEYMPGYQRTQAHDFQPYSLIYANWFQGELHSSQEYNTICARNKAQDVGHIMPRYIDRSPFVILCRRSVTFVINAEDTISILEWHLPGIYHTYTHTHIYRG